MHDFNVLKSGAVKRLPRRAAQRMVRYDTQCHACGGCNHLVTEVGA